MGMSGVRAGVGWRRRRVPWGCFTASDYSGLKLWTVSVPNDVRPLVPRARICLLSSHEKVKLSYYQDGKYAL